MRKKILPVIAALAAAGLFTLLFKPDSTGSVTKATAERREMPDVRMNTLDGKAWKLSDHRGKVVLVNYWASWCPPCRMETPGLVRIASEFAGKVEVAGISLDEGAEEVRNFVAQYKVPYAIMMPPPGDPTADSIPSLPVTILVDRQGRVAKTYMGAETERTFRRDIEYLLAER